MAMWGRQELVVRVEEAEIDAPGVQADRYEIALDAGQADSVPDFGVKAVEVPVEAATGRNRTILEAMGLFQVDGSAVETAAQRPPSGGPQIYGKVVLSGSQEFVKVVEMAEVVR